MDWSFQLYSARNYTPWENVLRTLAGLGYAQVEGFGGVYDNPSTFRAALDANGLAMPSGHFGMDLLEGDFGQARQIAEALGITLLAAPWLEPVDRPRDAAGWRGFGKRLGKIAAEADKAGLSVAWHNHDFEFETLPDGSIPMRHILDAAPGIGWEMDVAWVIRAGIDPLDWIDEFGSRIVAVHVKDIAPSGQALDEDGWADVGHGTVDWAGLISAFRAKTQARIFVMEHDNPSDLQRFASQSIDSVRNF